MEHPPVVAEETSVVMEHLPVVAGSHNDSAVAEPPDDDQFSYFGAASHIASEANSELMEAGDTPFQFGLK